MAFMENGVFPILEIHEQIFAKVYAATRSPQQALRAIGIFEDDNKKITAKVKQFLANPAIQQAVLIETEKYYKSKKYDRVFAIEKAVEILEDAIAKSDGKGMKSRREGLMAIDLIAKLQNLYSENTDGQIKQLAQINVVLNNPLGDRRI